MSALLPNRQQLLEQVLNETDTVLLSFSRGKDSLAAWLVLRDFGIRVVPFHMEIVPGLQFCERSLRYYEDFFGTHIYRTLHPNTYHWIRTMGFQPPERGPAILDLNLPRFDYHDVQRGVARTAGLPENTWCAEGTRIVDSLTRRRAYEKRGPFNFTKRIFSPIFDMKKDELIALLRHAGVKLPQEYQFIGRSFDQFSYQFLSIIQREWPDDYQRILEWFPLAHLAFAKLDMVTRHEHAA